MTKTILVKAVTRRSAVQKITGALDGLVRPMGEALLGSPIGLKEAWGRARKLSRAHKSNQSRAVRGRALPRCLVFGRLVGGHHEKLGTRSHRQ
jgi:hypothetical protein